MEVVAISLRKLCHLIIMKKGSEVDIYWNFQNHIEKQQLAFSETESVTGLTKPF